MILQAKNLSKSFSYPTAVHVLKDVSLDLREGESIAISGRSGEGKTTLLHLLGTLEKPDSGTLQIAGKKVSSSQAPFLRNRHIGFIFQSFNLLDDFTALENVLMPAFIARKTCSKAQGLSLLEQVGLADRADFPTKLLSGGEKQRIAIARALCNDPPLLLADEPLGNLDQHNALVIGQLLFSLVSQKKKGLVLVTHDEALAAQCDRHYVLSQGVLKINLIKN